ncbi:unnamed protein product, partial [Mesorhabditis belari]|uniref:Uncharacterized protein n=1 Tax=Mesorhabditis belari TaxID=2138241 RepID=A0AAF3ERA2_9BILA
MIQCPPHAYEWNDPNLIRLLGKVGSPYLMTIFGRKPPECHREDGYTFLENGTIRMNPAFNSTPNVYILVLDSAGRYPALRQLKRTYAFMIDEMGAIDFTRYNHVGYTSRDNALVAFSGIIGEKADRSLFGGTILKSSFKCDQFLDNQSHIFFEFEDAGYQTMFAQDYPHDLYAYMDCAGYKNDFAAHLFRPFILLTTPQDSAERRTWSKIVERTLLEEHLLKPENCGRTFQHVLRYLERFIDSYEDSPKISIVWTNEGHDEEKGFRVSDHHYEKFLRDNREKLKDAFLIVMGDHGQKGGKIGDTEQGQFENLTPLMLFSVPQKLRDTPLEAMVRKNADQVFTPHDLHATLIDIVRNQAKIGFRDTNYLRINATRGNSWLRELDPDLPRDCQHLPIPAQGFKITPKLIEANFEAYLSENGVLELCEMARVENITKMRQVLLKEQLIAIRVEFFTAREAKFMVTFGIQPNGSLFMQPKVFVRLNRYHNTADCISAQKAALRPVCYCKAQEKGRVIV